jgi:UDP-N-acetylmuramoylalanine--D-glutamate ligase
LTGTRALVVGLGIEGIAMARFLAGRGARVTVTDAKPAEALRERMQQLEGVPVTYALGGLDPALTSNVEELYVSQAVPLHVPLIVEARRRERPVRSIVTLAYDIFRGKVAAVTGSSGKTTTTSLVSAIFTAAGRRHVLAGNIGIWPLAELAAAPDDGWAVMEISHTQLQLAERSPHIGCVTNVTPNHLDQFSWEEYVALKRNHVRLQSPLDVAVLNLDNAVTRGFRRDTPAEVLYFSMSGDLPGDGAFLREQAVIWRRNGWETAVLPASAIPLRGRHNVENVLAATAVAGAAEIPMDAVSVAVRGFRAVPHRLEPVATVNGVTWYNDSIATAPERTLAGMRSFHEPLVLLLGGRDKHLPLTELADECASRCRAVVTFGEAGDLFADAVQAAAGNGHPAVVRTERLSEAVEEAATLSRPGDVVLLSPAGTSFDAYPNFERRGEEFRRLVREMGSRQPAARVEAPPWQ